MNALEHFAKLQCLWTSSLGRIEGEPAIYHDPVIHVRFAFVEFEIRAEAQDALDKYSGYTVEGRRLKVDWDPGRERKQDRRGGGQPTDERG